MADAAKDCCTQCFYDNCAACRGGDCDCYWHNHYQDEEP
jgi:hypothetical protein